MPSKLVTSTARFVSSAFAVRERAKSTVARLTQGVQTLSIRGPFLGLQPDVDPNLTDGTSFRNLTNVLARAHGEDHGEVLGLPDGYRQIDSTRLPLGDTSPPADATTADPVLRLDQVARFSPTTGDITGEYGVTPMAVTGLAGFDSGANLSGNMYRISPSTSQWTYIAESVATSDARALKARRDGRTVSPSMPDSCAAPFGATARAANTGAPNDDLQTGPITEPCWIFTNDVDEVMVFPSSTATPTTYEPLCDPTSSVTLDSGGANGFKAKSCETWNGRVYFLNTSEAGIRRQQRLRRTAKFTADPMPTIVGAGFYDFRDFQGEGLRIETLGDVLAVYFSDGVALMRPTGVATNPDEPQVISTERGLLSTHGVVSIGRNVHFGIFTDGWWMLDQSGRWQEVGVVNIDGKMVPKWRQTFYEGIPANQRHRIYTYYDQPANLIYIARPTESSPEPSEVWIYDPTSDRVFIENYPVTCFGSYTPPAQAGTVINSLVGTIDSQTVTIDSFGAIPGFPKVRVHGDTAGFVYQHRRDFVGYHGQEIAGSGTPTVQNPSWSFSSGLRSPSGIRNLSTVDRITLEYFNHDNASNVSVVAQGVSGSQTRTVVLNEGNHESLQTRDAWFRFTSRGVGMEVSGLGEFHIRAIEVDLWADPLEQRGS